MRTVNWQAFCHDYNIKTGKVRQGTWLACICPFHKDTNPSGAINLKTGSFHCWSCGTETMFNFVSTVAGCSPEVREVFKVLDPYTTGKDYMVPVVDEDKELEREITVKIDKGLKMPGHSPLSPLCRKYLKKRGLNPDYMEKHYGLKDGGVGGPWAYRIMIPVYEDGKLVCWQGRHIGDDKIRYKSSSKKESKNIKECVFNIDNVPGDTCVVVEGVFDVFKIGPGAVCLCGISVEDIQLRLLAERFKTVYMMFDHEPEAQKRAKECQAKLDHMGVEAINVDVSGFDGKDAGDMGIEEVLEIRKELLGDNSGEAPWMIKDKEKKR